MGTELRARIDREIMLQYEQPIMSIHNLADLNVSASTVERESNG